MNSIVHCDSPGRYDYIMHTAVKHDADDDRAHNLISTQSRMWNDRDQYLRIISNIVDTEHRRLLMSSEYQSVGFKVSSVCGSIRFQPYLYLDIIHLAPVFS